MSDETLDPDAIAALFAARERGDLPEEAATATATRKPKRIRPVDFTRPIKFTPEQLRRIRETMDRFCQATGTALTAELRTPVELEPLDSVQLTWWDAQQGLLKDVVNTKLSLRELGTSCLISAELSLLLVAIENLLGGAGDRVPASRRLSDIDRRLGQKLMAGVAHQLSAPWFDLAGTHVDIAEFDIPMESQTVSASEPTLVLIFEVRIGESSHTLSFVLPHSAIKAVEDRMAGREDAETTGADSRVAESVSAVLSDIDVTVRAAGPALAMSASDVLALRPGDTISLGAKVSEGVTLFANDQPVHRAVPGRDGARRAVQVLGPAGVPR